MNEIGINTKAVDADAFFAIGIGNGLAPVRRERGNIRTRIVPPKITVRLAKEQLDDSKTGSRKFSGQPGIRKIWETKRGYADGKLLIAMRR
jgi:hypothetical protein